nr:orotidine 5'-phosphate decarboxylase / HUMPS family protein [Oenococcus oeni]
MAVAGGIDLKSAAALSKQNLTEIIIVGGAISGADDPVQSAKKFMEVIK